MSTLISQPPGYAGWSEAAIPIFQKTNLGIVIRKERAALIAALLRRRLALGLYYRQQESSGEV